METIAFYLFAVLTIAMFSYTVMSSQALYALSSMAAGMIMISAFFFLLNADFLGVVQIIVYTGAVMALYAFGMMFFDTTRAVKEHNTSKVIVLTLSVLATLLVVAIFAMPIAAENISAAFPVPVGVENPKAVGIVLFTKYLVPFEVAAVMLLVAMIAGIVMAGKKMDRSLTKMKEEEITMIRQEETEQKVTL
ncbi:NADH-quinone oxidoreductase subunit J [Sulfurimonas sp. HSL-3221]|uniref:NADH-quinone oxidoreductase subunit J n=1 Tax=Sulfurimonadaceae TaxID=2771471 RepID=UPI001E2F8711|nr:NADH-quinone oxidoreductase subunit J [Sulfurimonas sp. HSL-3221]UFS62233.1 NADH-quinone oxidoreductase subunit J [Sulfurimonas sp. HSL-3221]